MTLTQKRIFFYIILITVIFLSYFELIKIDTQLEYDDKLLIGSLKSIHDFPSYFQAIKNGLILDIQPIRDLSYWIDFQLFNMFGWYSYHLTNTFLLVLICYKLELLLRETVSENYLIFLFVFVFAVSPVTSSSVAWIAARKHLLSTFFILWATNLTVKNKNNSTDSNIKILILYSLSVLSHPISLLWPLWMIFWKGHEWPVNKINFLKNKYALLLMSIFLILNFWYYKTIYHDSVSNFSKFSKLSNYDLGLPLLSIGRYFYQTIFPFSALPTSHYPGSLENFIGLIGFVSFLFVLKIHKTITSRATMLYFILPLLIVTFNMTNVFCSDTYILNASIGVYWSLANFMDQKKSKRVFFIVITTYLLFLTIYNYNYLKIFRNEVDLWTYSFIKEATPQSAGITSTNYVKKGKFKDSFLVIETIQTNWPKHPFLPQLIAENIFFNPAIDIRKKITTLESVENKTPNLYFYLNILYARENEIYKLEKNIHKIFKDPQMFNTELRGSEEQIAAAYIYMCESFNIKNCQTELDKFVLENVKQRWNEKLFQDRLSRLRQNLEFKLDFKI